MSASNSTSPALQTEESELVANQNSAVAPPAAAGAPDLYHGRGGSYFRDSTTGERVLIERTGPCGCDG